MTMRRLLTLGIRDSRKGRIVVALEAPERESSTGGEYANLRPGHFIEDSEVAGVYVRGRAYGHTATDAGWRNWTVGHVTSVAYGLG